jgi:pimeloyl-ACP methyl ester carboxylesterase
VRISDLRGIVQLATQATGSITHIVEEVHQSVWSTWGFPGGETPGKTRGITGLVYKTIHAVTRLTGKGADTMMAGLQQLIQSTESEAPESPRRRAYLAVLNGVMGDRLIKDNSPFAIPMNLRYQEEPLNWQSPPPLAGASSNVLLLIHGLCMDDLQQHGQRSNNVAEHGEALASALGYSPVYLSYNSGLHISQNGRELSDQLEQLVDCWPIVIEDLSVIAHSMGGLLIRSALHYAKQAGLRWPQQIGNIVFLGTPHHGAALERAGNWLDVILGATRYTKPFVALGQLRSAGITDLRYGNVLHEDWHGHDRFHLKPDTRQHAPLPETVPCHTVAATLAEKRGALADHLVGDGVVSLRSALGQHKEAKRSLSFSESSQMIAYQTSHMDLLTNAEVLDQIVLWLKTRAKPS